MALPAIMAGVSAASSLVGGIMAAKAQKASMAQQQAMYDKALQEFEAIGLPPDLSKKIIMEQFQQVGILEPEMEQQIDLAQSNVAGLKEDQGLRNTQMDVLSQIAQRGQVGLSPVERAELNKIRQQTARDTEAKRQQILSEMQSRGMAGSGNELIASLQASQAGADVASEEGDRLAAMASQNALNALAQSGQLSSGIRSQDWQANMDRASAADQFSLQDWAAQNARQSTNVGARNAAQAANLSAKQNVSNMNTAQENAERQRMEQAKRDYFQDRMNLAAGKSGQYQGMGNLAAQQGQAQANMYTGIASGLGNAAAAYGQYSADQTNQQLNRENALEVAKLKK